MKLAGTSRRQPVQADLLLRLGLGLALCVPTFLLGIRGWPVAAGVFYLLVLGANVLAKREFGDEGRDRVERVQSVLDALVIGVFVHMTGAITTVAVMAYPVLIFGVTLNYGASAGRLARKAANYSYFALIAATYFGLLPYDPYVRGASHLEFILTHNVVFAALPLWVPFFIAGGAVLAVNLATFGYAAHLVRERDYAQRALVDSVSRRVVADVVTGVSGSLASPLLQASALLDSAREDLAHLRNEWDVSTVDAESDLALAAQLVGQSRGLIDRLGELTQLPSDFREVLSLNELVGRARMELAKEYGAKVFSILQHIDPDLPAVRGEATLLYRAIYNLLENALRAIPEEEGRVQISTYAREGRVVLECADNGEGLGEEVQAHLFDPFYSATPASEHPGLGLALVREVIAQHQGELEIESAPGIGTTVRLDLPRVA